MAEGWPINTKTNTPSPKTPTIFYVVSFIGTVARNVISKPYKNVNTYTYVDFISYVSNWKEVMEKIRQHLDPNSLNCCLQWTLDNGIIIETSGDI